jgi:acetyl esterase/lipase
MSDTPQFQPINVPARDIPVPSTISPQAQAVLGMGKRLVGPAWPPVEDKEAVASVIAERDRMSQGGGQGPAASSCYGTAKTGVPTEVNHRTIDGVSIYDALPEGVSADDKRLYIAIHGAWITGGGLMAKVGAEMTAGAVGARTWVVDYRMPPYHPYPAPLDDCVTAYRAALRDRRPKDIIIGGMSGGANLTLATILRARDEGLPLPAAAVVNSPPADLTKQGDTYTTNDFLDISYTGDELEMVYQLYLNGHDRMDPLVSPVFGDYTKGFPPTILTTGTRDFLLSDTVRIHRKLRAAGIEAELHVWEAAPHFVFMGMAPEDMERVAEVRKFVDRHWVKGGGE